MVVLSSSFWQVWFFFSCWGTVGWSTHLVLTTICNSSSGGVFWPPQVPGTLVWHRQKCRQNTHVDKINNLKNRGTLLMRFFDGLVSWYQVLRTLTCPGHFDSSWVWSKRTQNTLKQRHESHIKGPSHRTGCEHLLSEMVSGHLTKQWFWREDVRFVCAAWPSPDTS